jgi:hypothetical protein
VNGAVDVESEREYPHTGKHRWGQAGKKWLSHDAPIDGGQEVSMLFKVSLDGVAEGVGMDDANLWWLQ